MEKKLSDYLHFYLGCQVKTNGGHDGKYSRVGTFLGYADHHRLDCRLGFRAGPEGRCSVFLLRPILRPLSDMSEKEMQECGNMAYDFRDDPDLNKWEWKDFQTLLDPTQFMCLLSKGFDLFNLIEDGLAVDATKRIPV